MWALREAAMLGLSARGTAVLTRLHGSAPEPPSSCVAPEELNGSRSSPKTQPGSCSETGMG